MARSSALGNCDPSTWRINASMGRPATADRGDGNCVSFSQPVLGSVGLPEQGALLRLLCTFLRVGRTIDHLQVGNAPIGQQHRPPLILLPPHPEERYAMVHFGISGEPRAAHRTAPALNGLQLANIVARNGPQIPCGDAAAVPGGMTVGGLFAKGIAVPAEPEDRLPANTAMSLSSRMRLVPKGNRRRPEARPQLRCRPPHPAWRVPGLSGECAGEAIGPHNMMPPVRFDGPPRCGRDQRPV